MLVGSAFRLRSAEGYLGSVETWSPPPKRKPPFLVTSGRMPTRPEHRQTDHPTLLIAGIRDPQRPGGGRSAARSHPPAGSPRYRPASAATEAELSVLQPGLVQVRDIEVGEALGPKSPALLRRGHRGFWTWRSTPPGIRLTRALGARDMYGQASPRSWLVVSWIESQQ
jgi:hypothetical protein